MLLSAQSPDLVGSKGLVADVILARFEPEFVLQLLEVWKDPDSFKVGLTEPRFAQLCGLSQAAIYNYLHKDRYPDSKALRKMGQFFGIYFVEDWNSRIDNSDILKMVKAQHAL